MNRVSIIRRLREKGLSAYAISESTGIPASSVKRIIREKLPKLNTPEFKSQIAPMSNKKTADLTGRRYGNLLVVSESEEKTEKGLTVWSCLCACGKVVNIPGKKLKSGKVKSCGCLNPPKRPVRSIKEYSVWMSMRSRCNNPKDSHYKNYGGRGIKVCEQWNHNFKAFYADMGPRPEGFTIERKNNDGDYCPENCVWASSRTQNANKSTNVQLAANGKIQIQKAWARELGIKEETIIKRLRMGYTMQEIYDHFSALKQG